jgi:phage-related protein
MRAAVEEIQELFDQDPGYRAHVWTYPNDFLLRTFCLSVSMNQIVGKDIV